MLCAFLPLGRGRVGLAKLPPPCLRGGAKARPETDGVCKVFGWGRGAKGKEGGKWTGREEEVPAKVPGRDWGAGREGRGRDLGRLGHSQGG